MCTHNFWSVADCSLVKQKYRKQKKAACMADLLLCIICPYNSELKIGWPNVKPFWWTDPSKRLQKRLTRLSISPSKRLLSKVERKGVGHKYFNKTFFFRNGKKRNTEHILVYFRQQLTLGRNTIFCPKISYFMKSNFSVKIQISFGPKMKL